MPTIIDTAEVTTGKLAALKAAGVQTIIRYLTTSSNSAKLVRETEARAIAAHGLNLALVFENWGGSGRTSFEHDDIHESTGTNHGVFVRSYAPSIGAPEGTLVWFAIDTDVQPREFERLVVPYLIAAKQALGGRYRLGLYSNGMACRLALDRGLVDGAWLAQSTGWLGYRSFKDSGRWTLLQGPETAFHGLDVDPNTPNAPDHGQFAPFEAAATAPSRPAEAPPVTSPAHPATTEPAGPKPAPAASPGPDLAFGRLPSNLTQIALDAATRSTIMRDHTWQRVGKGPIGKAPIGYLKGMTLAYLRLRAALADGNSLAQAIAAPVKPDDDRRDVLSWFRSKFTGFGGLADKGGPDTLRHVFVVLYPLGMNESDGKFCCGRDVTAVIPPSSDTVEAGLFQTSWDMRDGCPEVEPLFRSYQAAGDDPEGLASIFHEGVRCSRDDLENVGHGDGREFQRMSKASPMFAVLAAAIGVRFVGGAKGLWGPIRRREVDVWSGADDYFRALDALVDVRVA